MGADILIIVLIIVVFLTMSAFCSASETGLTTASKSNLHKQAMDGNERARTAIRLREMKDKLISTLLLGNNATNTAFSVVVGLFWQ